MYDVAVIGAGVIGCAIARELTRYTGSVVVVEKGEDVCTGTSKANSAIVHGGFDAENGTMKAKMNVLGNRMMTRISEELDVPFRRNGAFVLCFQEEDRPALETLYERGVKNGLTDLSIVSGDEARKMEPNLSENVVAALWCPSSGIVCPFELTLGFAENAAKNGAEFRFLSGVTGVARGEDGFTLETESGEIRAKAVVNAAGVYADRIHDLLLPHDYTVTARRGEYCLCDKTVGGLVDRTIFQLPTKLGKGVLVTPTVHGNLLLGPTAEDTDDKEYTATTAFGLADLQKRAALSVKSLPTRQVITSFSGLRAHTDVDDFILREAAPGFFEAAGIESPGLTSAPVIGEMMAEKIAAALGLSKRADFDPIRKGVPHIYSLPEEERRAYIEKDPLYGSIVCRCETVSEGEIRDAIRRTPGATTLDGVKRRTRAGMGRCQAGFCSPRVMEILSRELGLPLSGIRKNTPASVLVYGKTK